MEVLQGLVSPVPEEEEEGTYDAKNSCAMPSYAQDRQQLSPHQRPLNRRPIDPVTLPFPLPLTRGVLLRVSLGNPGFQPLRKCFVRPSSDRRVPEPNRMVARGRGEEVRVLGGELEVPDTLRPELHQLRSFAEEKEGRNARRRVRRWFAPGTVPSRCWASCAVAEC